MMRSKVSKNFTRNQADEDTVFMFENKSADTLLLPKAEYRSQGAFGSSDGAKGSGRSSTVELDRSEA